MNNNERELWVLNDEDLYNWFTSTHRSMRAFLKENRETIDSIISGKM